jgi:hypothetical protein
MPTQDDDSGGLTVLGLGSARRPPGLPKKQEQGPRKRTPREEAASFAIFLFALGLFAGSGEAEHYMKLRNLESLEGIRPEVLLAREAEERVENGDSRVWVSPSTKTLAIRFEKLHSVDGNWAGAMGEVAVRGEGSLGGYHRCVPEETRIDWGKEMTTGNPAAEFEPECSVELPMTEAYVHKSFAVTARMGVTRPVIVWGGVVQGGRQVDPGAFENTTEEMSREFQLFVASADEVKRMHQWTAQQAFPYGLFVEVFSTLFSLGALGGAVLLWRHAMRLARAEHPRLPH